MPIQNQLRAEAHQQSLLAAVRHVLLLDLAEDRHQAVSADAASAMAALRKAISDIDPRSQSPLMVAAFNVLDFEFDRQDPGLDHKYEYALMALRAAAHDLDSSIEAPTWSVNPYNVWISAFCATWSDLVNGTDDAVDLADWAEALYAIHGHQDPYEVAKATFEESERCG